MRRAHRTIALLACLTAACGSEDLTTGPGSPADPIVPQADIITPNSWTARAGMPTGRYGLAAATVNGLIYAIGGDAGSAVSAKVEAFNPNTKTLVAWLTRAPMPEPRSFTNGAAVINGKIFLSGGFKPTADGSRQRTKTLYRFDPGTNTWSKRADMPRVSSGGATVAIDGRLYVYIAYGPDNSDGAALYRYDPSTNAWLERATPPAIQSSAAVAILDGKMWLIGGSQGKASPVATVSVYNPGTNTWAVRHPLHYARAGPTARNIDGTIYVAAGVAGSGQTIAATEVYDLGTDSWSLKADIPTPRGYVASGVVDGRLYVIGGTAGAGRTNEMYVP